MNNITLKEAAKLFVGKKNIRLLCHIRPDGDTLGSAFGLKYALEGSGKHVVNVVCEDEVPKRLWFLTEGVSELSTEGAVSPDLVCSIDCATLQRITRGEYEGTIDLKIDHHKDGTDFAAGNYVEEDSAATGEIIYLLIRELEGMGEAAFTEKAATSVYAALSSDTGSFKYSNVTSRTMRIAADLIDLGANSSEVSYRLYGIKTRDEIAAEKIMYEGMELFLDGKVAFLLITNKMKNGIIDDAFGDIVSCLRTIEGVELSVTLRQEDGRDESFRISMRSGESISSSDLCRLFGGGGHERAAGATIKAESPEAARKTVLDAVLSALK